MTTNLNLLTTFADDFALIAGLMTRKAEIRDEVKAANEAVKEQDVTLAEAIRQLAKKTHEAGVSVEDLTGVPRRKGLFQLGLELSGAPSGTVAASANHLKGYRAMLADGLPIDNVSTKDAQDYIASDEVKAKKAFQKAFRDHTKEWKAADWEAHLRAFGIISDDKDESVSADEAAEIEREAQAA